jgi:hypothetical protein
MKQITTARATDSALKIFAVTFVVSSAATLCLREFGLGSKIWPAHPFMATLATALACGIAVQATFFPKTFRAK